MTSASHLVARASAVAAAISAAAVGAPVASAADLANPAPLIEAFRTTCLTDFPNVDAVARNAIAAGWIERKVTLIGPPGKGMSATNLPRIFEWRGLTMSIMRAGDGIRITTCQVSSPSAVSLNTETLVAATNAALGLSGPVKAAKNGTGPAQWRRAPGQLIQASTDKAGAMRSANLLVRLEAEVPAKMNFFESR